MFGWNWFLVIHQKIFLELLFLSEETQFISIHFNFWKPQPPQWIKILYSRTNSAIAGPKPGWERRRVERRDSNPTKQKHIRYGNDYNEQYFNWEKEWHRPYIENDNSPIVDLLTPKQHMSCWNVRTLYQYGKQAHATNAIKQYNLSMLASRVRWTGKGKQIKLRVSHSMVRSKW